MKRQLIFVIGVSVFLLSILASTLVVNLDATEAATQLSHTKAKKMLNAVGIKVVSSGGCSNRNVSTCTSLSKIRKATIEGIIAFKEASGCKVTITGGTETGHSSGKYSHWNGYKVDIKLTTCVNRYITQHYDYTGKRSDGAKQYRDGSDIYARESNHWDILFK